jgi:hypothetical protein
VVDRGSVRFGYDGTVAAARNTDIVIGLAS